jgi:hypothetical protein
MPPPRSLIIQLLAQPTLLPHHPVLPLPRHLLQPIPRLHPRRSRISPQLPLHLPPLRYDVLSRPPTLLHPGLPRGLLHPGLPRGLLHPGLPRGLLNAGLLRRLLHRGLLRTCLLLGLGALPGAPPRLSLVGYLRRVRLLWCRLLLLRGRRLLCGCGGWCLLEPGLRFG